MDETIHEALLALTGFSMFFIFATLSSILASANPDSYIYVEYSPPEDFYYLIGLLFGNFVFSLYFLMQTLNFRRSYDLDKRYGELLFTSNKMLAYSCFFLPVIGILIFYLVVYFETLLAITMLLTVIFDICLFLLIAYNSYRIRQDYKEEVAER